MEAIILESDQSECELRHQYVPVFIYRCVDRPRVWEETACQLWLSSQGAMVADYHSTDTKKQREANGCQRSNGLMLQT